MSDSYNGWTNYETWAVNLWLGNDPGSVDHWEEQAREVAEQARADGPGDVLSPEEQARQDLADRLSDYHDEIAPELEGVFADLFSAALSSVDWYEIATAWLADAVEPAFWEQVECVGCGDWFDAKGNTSGSLCRDCSGVEEEEEEEDSLA